MRNGIKPKTGICSDCTDGKEKPLTAKRCDFHYKKHRAEVNAFKTKKRAEMNAFLGNAPKVQKKPKPIPQYSAKQIERLAKYRKVRDEFMKLHPICQSKLTGCTVKATDLHHKSGRTGEMLTDTKYFMALCRSCHNKIEDGGQWVYDMGFKVNRV